mmetsp:Transcript_31845/g.85072  ORF Transcript_31845/g.85072 Transcript_31845/m.85072 type:complete len:446 (+) Transcript_31845:500-1837(+)
MSCFGVWRKVHQELPVWLPRWCDGHFTALQVGSRHCHLKTFGIRHANDKFVSYSGTIRDLDRYRLPLREWWVHLHCLARCMPMLDGHLELVYLLLSSASEERPTTLQLHATVLLRGSVRFLVARHGRCPRKLVEHLLQGTLTHTEVLNVEIIVRQECFEDVRKLRGIQEIWKPETRRETVVFQDKTVLRAAHQQKESTKRVHQIVEYPPVYHDGERNRLHTVRERSSIVSCPRFFFRIRVVQSSMDFFTGDGIVHLPLEVRKHTHLVLEHFCGQRFELQGNLVTRPVNFFDALRAAKTLEVSVDLDCDLGTEGLSLLHGMRRQHDHRLLARFSHVVDDFPHEATGEGIHAGGRLVQENDGRFSNESLRHTQFSLVPSGQSARVAITISCQLQAFQTRLDCRGQCWTAQALDATEEKEMIVWCEKGQYAIELRAITNVPPARFNLR